jgi:hypothetical protein
MEILSHRGYWKDKNEKNTIKSFVSSFENGFGIETDLRDFNEKLVISHDPSSEKNILFDQLMEHYKTHKNLTLALNIKSDGLIEILLKKIKEYSLKNYFVFDMSIPDTISYKSNNVNFFSRQSEYEKDIIFYEDCTGIWLDSFLDIWFDESIIEQHIHNSKKVVIVSPELHNRDYMKFWNKLVNWKICKSKDLYLCTDFPTEAKLFFNI